MTVKEKGVPPHTVDEWIDRLMFAKEHGLGSKPVTFEAAGIERGKPVRFIHHHTYMSSEGIAIILEDVDK